MGKKYIIELGRRETAYKTVDSKGTPLIQLLNPIPYTEPDLEQVRKEAYGEGFRDGQYAERNGLTASYAQKQEKIKVGDEVVSENDIKAVVIDMDDYLLHVLDENGLVQGWPREDVAKTDRHFHEIATILENMRGEQDG